MKLKEKWGEYLSVTELSKYLSVSKSYIYQNWGKTVFDPVRKFKMGKKILFNRKDVDKLQEVA